MALALDGSAHATANPAASLPVSLTTTHNSDIICVIITTNGGPVVSVTSPNLAFSRRSTSHVSDPSPIEFWRAIATDPLANEIITVGVTNSSIITVDAFGISGANTSIIFDADPSLPAASIASSLTINTGSANDFIIEAARGAGPTVDSAFTIISQADFQAVGYKIVSTAQSGLQIISGGGGDGILADAILGPFGPQVTTTLTNVPARAFTRKHYFNELEKIRGEALANQEILEGLDEKGRADLDFQLAQDIANSFDSITPTNYAKAMDAQEKLRKARKARDHHYFMDVVKKAWADHDAKKK